MLAADRDGVGLLEVDPGQDGVVRAPVATMDTVRDLPVVRLDDVTGGLIDAPR